MVNYRSIHESSGAQCTSNNLFDVTLIATGPAFLYNICDTTSKSDDVDIVYRTLLAMARYTLNCMDAIYVVRCKNE